MITRNDINIKEKNILSLLRKQIQKNDFANICVALESVDKKFKFVGADGVANYQTKEAMTPDTPYFIASITKMFTSAVIMQLFAEKKLDLETTISKYLPDSIIKNLHIYKGVDYSYQIKVYQLLNHTSGLADFETEKPKGDKSIFDKLINGNDLFIDLYEAVRITRSLTPHFAPGTYGKAHYSNTNYRLLAEIIQNVTQKSLETNFSERIFEPLNLKNTYFYDYTKSQIYRPPATFIYKKTPINIPKYISSNNADGGLVSNVSECLVFLRAFFEGNLFDNSLLKQMMKWNKIFFPIKYGYGIMYFQLPRYFSLKRLPEFIGHSGSTGSFAFLSPSNSLYLTGTLNQISPVKPFSLMIKLIRAIK